MRIRLLLTVLAQFGGRLESYVNHIVVLDRDFAFFFCCKNFRVGGRAFAFDNVIAFEIFCVNN